MNKTQQVLAIREGGQTQRCHTMQYIGPYNVAIHSYNALSLLLLLHDKEPPSLNLIKAVLWHDVPERWTGDTPAPAKWSSPVLKAILDSIEERILEKLGLSDLFKILTEEENKWLLGVDLLELLIWAKEQIILGNFIASSMYPRVMALINKKKEQIPLEIYQFSLYFCWERSVECDELIGGEI